MTNKSKSEIISSLQKRIDEALDGCRGNELVPTHSLHFAFSIEEVSEIVSMLDSPPDLETTYVFGDMPSVIGKFRVTLLEDGSLQVLAFENRDHILVQPKSDNSIIVKAVR